MVNAIPSAQPRIVQKQARLVPVVPKTKATRLLVKTLIAVLICARTLVTDKVALKHAHPHLRSLE